MTLSLTDQQIQTIIRLREIDHLKWPEIGKQFNISGEDARRKYRVATGTINKAYDSDDSSNQTSFEQTDNSIHIICSSPRMITQEDVIKQFNIDLEEWEIVSFKVKTSEGYRKDRKVDWHVKEGSVVVGNVTDTGKMLVVPLYHVEVRLIKRKNITDAKAILDTLIEDAQKFAPVYPKIEYPENDGLVFEIDMQDIHFGRLSWAEESGEDYDIKIARKAIESTLKKLLAFVSGQKLAKVVIPLGNDFFNVDNKDATTTRGTPQQEDTRYQKTYRIGREICVWMIDACSQLAPVDVLIIPGNHDEQRSFYLGDSLFCWYHQNQNVNIDNRSMKQKYYAFGNNLIGFTHGYDEKLGNLPLIMALDQPDLWAKAKYREWHTGDKHHKVDLIPKTDESRGLVVRILRSLAASDA